MNALRTPLPNHYLAKLYYKANSRNPQLVDWAYFVATKDPNKTAYNALRFTPRANYTVEIRRVTPHDLGMTVIGGEL